MMRGDAIGLSDFLVKIRAQDQRTMKITECVAACNDRVVDRVTWIIGISEERWEWDEKTFNTRKYRAGASYVVSSKDENHS